MRILVDIGNSRCKAAIEDADGLHALATFAWHDIFVHEVLDELWLKPLGNRLPGSVVVSDVAGERLLPNLSAWCYARLGIEPIAVASSASTPRRCLKPTVTWRHFLTVPLAELPGAPGLHR